MIIIVTSKITDHQITITNAAGKIVQIDMLDTGWPQILNL